MGCMDTLCNCVVNLLIGVVLILLSPLLLVEILCLLFCGIKCLPPLSCMIEKTPFTGEFDRSQIPPHNAIPEDVLKRKAGVDYYGMTWYQGTGTVAEKVKTMCELMLGHCNVSTTFDVCPSDLVGVFWMDGNSVSEELACLSYATTDPKISSNSFVFNKVNSTCSWTYLDSTIGKFIAWFQERGAKRGFQCFQFDDAELKNGRIWSYNDYSYSEQGLGWLTSLGEFSMERLEGPGVNYKRGCYWFSAVFGRRLEYGSYTLRKIMAADGTPVQPAYDEFVRHMETTNAGLSQITEAVPAAQEGDKVPLTAGGA